MKLWIIERNGEVSDYNTAADALEASSEWSFMDAVNIRLHPEPGQREMFDGTAYQAIAWLAEEVNNLFSPVGIMTPVN